MRDVEMGDVEISDGAAIVATSPASSGGETRDSPEARNSFSPKEPAESMTPKDSTAAATERPTSASSEPHVFGGAGSDDYFNGDSEDHGSFSEHGGHWLVSAQTWCVREAMHSDGGLGGVDA
ncbi:hypothetical protein NHQ30_010982 [Ciborinia camelliae]|nr:hypothetical protein NHQ30_010982 [Ciborinia camelliae]